MTTEYVHPLIEYKDEASAMMHLIFNMYADNQPNPIEKIVTDFIIGGNVHGKDIGSGLHLTEDASLESILGIEASYETMLSLRDKEGFDEAARTEFLKHIRDFLINKIETLPEECRYAPADTIWNESDAYFADKFAFENMEIDEDISKEIDEYLANSDDEGNLPEEDEDSDEDEESTEEILDEEIPQIFNGQMSIVGEEIDAAVATISTATNDDIQTIDASELHCFSARKPNPSGRVSTVMILD